MRLARVGAGLCVRLARAGAGLCVRLSYIVEWCVFGSTLVTWHKLMSLFNASIMITVTCSVPVLLQIARERTDLAAFLQSDNILTMYN